MELQDPARVPREWPKPVALGSCGLEYTAPPAGSEPDLAATPDSRTEPQGRGTERLLRGVGFASTHPPTPHFTPSPQKRRRLRGSGMG